MVKKEIRKNVNSVMQFDYDETKYELTYVKDKGLIVIKRLSDDTIVDVVGDNIGFIFQCEFDGLNHILMTEYSHDDEKVKLKHFVDDGYQWKLKKQFDCNSVWLQTLQVTNHSFLVEQDGVGAAVYNLNDKSHYFDKVYNDEKVKKAVGADVLLVTEKKYAYWSSEIFDTLTYGINPETFDIVTSIWSELQQRYIDVYSEEKVQELEEILKSRCETLNREHFNNAQITIHFEVQKYLDLLAHILEPQKSVYTDYNENKVNEDFVKQLIIK